MTTKNWTQVCVSVPTVEGLGRFIQTLVHDHPFITSATLLFWSYFPDIPFRTIYIILYAGPLAFYRRILSLVGFTSDGIARGSLAAGYQSERYGGNLPRDSLFASYQSYGATNVEYISEERRKHGWFDILIGWVAFVGAVVVLVNNYQNHH